MDYFVLIFEKFIFFVYIAEKSLTAAEQPRLTAVMGNSSFSHIQLTLNLKKEEERKGGRGRLHISYRKNMFLHGPLQRRNSTYTKSTYKVKVK